MQTILCTHSMAQDFDLFLLFSVESCNVLASTHTLQPLIARKKQLCLTYTAKENFQV
jgi:hypothetical protein